MKAASRTFKGFPPEGVAFLQDLKKHNDREWFAPRVELYKERVRAPMLELVRALHVAMLGFAPEYVGSDPAKCLYRVYRDVRFSKDKTPYKTQADALFWRSKLDKNTGAGFYFAISPEKVGIGAGLYMPSPAALLAVRQRVAADPDAFRSTFEWKTVRRLMDDLQGERLTRVPKGFSAEDPAADLLRFKQFVLYKALNPEIISTPKLFREILVRIEAVTPFLRFLDEPLLTKVRPPAD